MPFIYRYVLKDYNSRKNENLLLYESSIKETIAESFGNSLKEVIVDKDFFEFKLYSKVSDSKLQKMGRAFVKNDSRFYYINHKKTKKNNMGSGLFIRATSEYYGYLEYYQNVGDEIILNFDLVKKFNINEYKKYIDIQNNKMEALRNIETYKISMHFNKQIKEKFKEGNWYLISGTLSNNDNESEIYLDFTDFHKNDSKDDSGLISGFKTKLIKKIDNNTKKDLHKFFSLEGISYKKYDKKNISLPSIEKYKVIIYNVGQGLCSAICDENNHPFIYFDFGRGYGRDRCTYPGGMNYDSTHNPPIILSHWDTDHYILINECQEALNCKWITCSNVKGPYALKLFTELSARGKLVVISSKISLTWGDIIVGNGTRNHKHNDGLSLLLKLKSKEIYNNKKYKKCLLTGDNKYSVLPTDALNNLDVLLASHHGGTYDNVCDASHIPKGTSNGIIIYSYGKHEKFLPYNNSHKHPSYVEQYRNSGWINEVNTPDGNYILK